MLLKILSSAEKNLREKIMNILSTKTLKNEAIYGIAQTTTRFKT